MSTALLAVLGADAEPVIDSGDPVRDRHARDRFLQAYDAHVFDSTTEGTTTLQVGENELDAIQRASRSSMPSASTTGAIRKHCRPRVLRECRCPVLTLHA